MWQRRIGYVPQEVMLLDAPIRSNVALAVPPSDIDDERVRRALDRAGLLTDVDEMVGDITAEVGERGARLSGGQRQRLGLARALYDDPEFLVLDEATSALDSEVEAAIQGQLQLLMRNKTVIAIAHRLSTIAMLDRLIVIEQGKIVEQGSHAELLAHDGIYARLWRRQSGGFIDVEAAEEAAE